MRTILLTGAAIVVGLGLVTAVQAGPLWHMKQDLLDCASLAYVAQQLNCAEEVISDEGKSNDGNYQKIRQSNEATLGYPHDLVQLNVGGNLVVEGDYNTQKIYQSNSYDDSNLNVGTQTPVQINVGLNVVEDGDDNTQVISQSNSLTIGNNYPE
jgi:hypothetical protein